MSTYTLRGSAELDARIGADLARIAEAVSPHGLAGILLGGYGRGEGTPFIHADGSQSPFNDYDLVVVVEEPNDTVRRTIRSLEQNLSAELDLPVDLCVYRKADLPTCEFSLLNYEMKCGHKVIWGDEHVLDAMPDYNAAAIPHSEGSRLLLNRGKLLLDIKLRMAETAPLSEEEQIRFLKFIYKAWLALGDCALLAENKYDIAYAVKRERIDSIGDIPLRDIVIEHYLEAIQLKEWGDYLSRLNGFDMADAYQQVQTAYLDFFAWYRKLHEERECSLLKAMLLNLRWNGRPLLHHPRQYLYMAIQELLKDAPNEFRLREMLFSRDGFIERFYALQKRFS